jgi:hypothetical protein
MDFLVFTVIVDVFSFASFVLLNEKSLSSSTWNCSVNVRVPLLQVVPR